MPIFDFVVVASGIDPEAEDFEARFFDAGCDDATISFQHRSILVDFSLEAEDMAMAMRTALDDVRAAGARVECIPG